MGKWSLDSGIRRKLSHFEPVFKLSKSVLEHFDLHQSKQYTDDKVKHNSLGSAVSFSLIKIKITAKNCSMLHFQTTLHSLLKMSEYYYIHDRYETIFLPLYRFQLHL